MLLLALAGSLYTKHSPIRCYLVLHVVVMAWTRLLLAITPPTIPWTCLSLFLGVKASLECCLPWDNLPVRLTPKVLMWAEGRDRFAPAFLHRLVRLWATLVTLERLVSDRSSSLVLLKLAVLSDARITRVMAVPECLCIGSATTLVR